MRPTPQAHKIRAVRGEAAPVARSLAVVHASELLTLRGPRGPRIREAASELGIIPDGAVYIEGERIADLGTTQEVLTRHPRAATTLDASGKVVLPGLVDAHTHAIFAGSRAHEIEWKAQGLSYAEIAARGGGILHTMRATRDAEEAELVRLGVDRLLTFVSFGTTTVEVKSGYGLRTADELKMLRAAAEAGRAAGVDVVPTFLGAHAVPPEYEGRSDAYVDLLLSETLLAVSLARGATFCDAFVDEGYFSVEQGRRLFEKASALGLRPKVHADEIADTGGAGLAAAVRAVSADHVLRTSEAGMEAMAQAGVIATLLPATSLSSRVPYADGRRWIAAGVPVALGTDFNPNCWCESMQLVIALACHHNGLLPAQAITAATINAAHAIGRGDEVGSLERGKLADLLILDAPSYHHLGYRLGGDLAEAVVKRGRIRKGRALTR
ncbi:MAG TPA: imidazolonepropionase [Thermoplasmata archaeon]|nr:imidazolonepropionase [Thermoplasmata archaeon]